MSTKSTSGVRVVSDCASRADASQTDDAGSGAVLVAGPVHSEALFDSEDLDKSNRVKLPINNFEDCMSSIKR